MCDFLCHIYWYFMILVSVGTKIYLILCFTDQIGFTPEEVISKIMANPDVAMAFQNPRVQAAIMDVSPNSCTYFIRTFLLCLTRCHFYSVRRILWVLQNIRMTRRYGFNFIWHLLSLLWCFDCRCRYRLEKIRKNN